MQQVDGNEKVKINPAQPDDLTKKEKVEASKFTTSKTPPDYEPDPEFKQNYKKAGCFSRFFWNYSWPVIEAYHKNGQKIEEDTLEDMYIDEKVGERLVEDFERNLKLRLDEMSAVEKRTLQK